MPRLKTESEVATMSYLRQRTSVPVPTIYHYDSNPYNRLGGEFILMSKVRFSIGSFTLPQSGIAATRTCVIAFKILFEIPIIVVSSRLGLIFPSNVLIANPKY